jgi:hypothetical protein
MPMLQDVTPYTAYAVLGYKLVKSNADGLSTECVPTPPGRATGLCESAYRLEYRET